MFYQRSADCTLREGKGPFNLPRLHRENAESTPIPVVMVTTYQRYHCEFSRELYLKEEKSNAIVNISNVGKKSFRFQSCRLATRSFSSLHRFLMGFRSGDWLGHSRTLMCFFLSHSFVALAVCFGSLSCWKTHPWTHLQCSHWGKEVVAQNFPVHGPIHPPLDTVKSSCPLSWETCPKHKVSISMLHSGDGVLGVVLSISLPPNMASRVDAK